MKIRIKSELTAPRCRRLRENFLSIVQKDVEIYLDLSEVPDMDSCGVQLLLSLRKELEARGGALTITARSTAVGSWMDFLQVVPV